MNNYERNISIHIKEILDIAINVEYITVIDT